MTAQSLPGTRQSMGSTGRLSTIIAPMISKLTTNESQKRRKMRGTSLKKFERSTSFFVAPHVMLYEKRWARSACERWMERPPKKKKLRAYRQQCDDNGNNENTYKNGTQVRFSMSESSRLRCPRRYSSSV